MPLPFSVKFDRNPWSKLYISVKNGDTIFFERTPPAVFLLCSNNHRSGEAEFLLLTSAVRPCQFYWEHANIGAAVILSNWCLNLTDRCPFDGGLLEC